MTTRLPFRRTLAFRTVAGVVLLLAAVLAATSIFITVLTQRTLDAQLNDAVRQSMARSAAFAGGEDISEDRPQTLPEATDAPEDSGAAAATASPGEDNDATGERDPLETPGQPVGVLSVEVVDGVVTRATYLTSQGTSQDLPEADIAMLQEQGLGEVEQATKPEDVNEAPLHRLELSLGNYCVGAVDLGAGEGDPAEQGNASEGAAAEPSAQTGATEGKSTRVIVTGLPTAQVENTRDVLLAGVTGGSAAALLVTALLGLWWIRRSLRPLARVSSSAAQVAALQLDSGEVPVRDHLVQGELARPGTEVGDVGYALNLLLINVDDALQQRNASEAQLRQFVADASHELRTPLASVRGYADMLRLSEQLTPQGRVSLERLLTQAQRMGGLVDDLLLLARLDAGRAPEAKPVDLGEIVAEAVMDATAAGPDHRWDLEVPAEPVTVSGDALQLTQVVGNLLSNARKHTPPGTSVRATLTSRGRQAVLHIDDDGPGIPAQLKDHLFDRFARADTARTHRSGDVASSSAPSGPESRTASGDSSEAQPNPSPGAGSRTVSGEGSTGLGLAIVRTVAEAHGGEADVESPPRGQERGTRFIVRLPLAPPRS